MGTKHIGAGILLLGTSWSVAQAGGNSNSILEINGLQFSSLAGAISIDNKGDSLIAQRTDGDVFYVANGKKKAVLNLAVANGNGQGLLDIEESQKFNKDHQVYLYYTPAKADGGIATGLKLGLYAWNASSHMLVVEKTTNVKLPSRETAVQGQIGFDSKFRASVTFPAKSKMPAVTPLPASSTGSIIEGATGTISSSSGPYTGILTINTPVGGAGTMIVGTNGAMGTTSFNQLGGYAGVTLGDFSSVGVIGGGSNDLIINNANLTLNSDALFRINDLNPTLNFSADPQYPVILYDSPLDSGDNSISSAFRGSFNLVTSTDDPNFPSYHVIDLTAEPISSPPVPSLTTSPAPEPDETVLLISGIGALLAKRQRTPLR